MLFVKRLLIPALVVFAAACGSSDVGADRLKDLNAGDSRETVLSVMGSGPLTARMADTLRLANGFRRQSYLVEGRNFEVLWFRVEPGSLADSIVQRRETPVLLESDTLVGWGWKLFGEKAREFGLPNPALEKARLDSIAASQAPRS